MNRAEAPLRILHIASGDLWAGAEAQVAALLSELARSPEVELHAALLNPGELAERLQAAGIPVTVLDESRLSAFSILWGIRQLVRSFDPQVVHTHRTKENVLGGVAAWLEGRRRSVRTVHGAPEHRPPSWRIDKQVYRALDGYAARRWQQVSVAVSEDLGRLLRSAGSGAKVEVVHNGLDPALFAELRSRRVGRQPDRTRRVLLLGRLVPVKRADLFLRTARTLVSRAAVDWHFDVVGDGPLLAGTRSLARDLAIDDRVTFHGFRSDAVDLLAASDVLVFSSDHEGTPMAALEALAIGVPIVARAVGGLVEMLEGIPGCRLVPGDRPEALAAAIEQVVGPGETARPELPQRYGIAACAQQYRELYSRLVAGT
jgi:glycosyltransferase involved in cell wall biosynthesis